MLLKTQRNNVTEPLETSANIFFLLILSVVDRFIAGPRWRRWNDARINRIEACWWGVRFMPSC